MMNETFDLTDLHSKLILLKLTVVNYLNFKILFVSQSLKDVMLMTVCLMHLFDLINLNKALVIMIIYDLLYFIIEIKQIIYFFSYPHIILMNEALMYTCLSGLF